MKTDELRLLSYLYDSFRGGAFAMACDGGQRPLAHNLEKRGLAEWRGTNWGSSFWSITDAGRELIEAAAEPAGDAQ